MWPNVSSLPDYKATFPRWTSYNLETQVKNMNKDAVDLLKQMVVYDPAKRISAKRIALHAYFRNVDRSVKPIFDFK